MIRFFRHITALVTVIGGSLALATPAEATTSTVTIGSTASGSGTYIRASTGSVKWSDTTTGVVFTCTSATAAGAVPHLGTGLSNPVMTQTSGTYTSCTGWGGLTFTISQSGTWSIDLSSYTGGVDTGSITGVTLHFTASGCSYNVTGSTDLTFSNSTQVMSISPVAGSGHVLTISGVSGCFGIVANGHAATLVGSFHVTAKTATGVAGALKITSP